MTDSRRAPNVFTIPGTEPFLATLHASLTAGRLIEGWDPGDPLAWSELTILVPTRRAGRALRELFLERSGSDAVILPRIRPIGDVDEDIALFQTDDADAEVAPAVSGFERHMVLTRLVMRWTGALGAGASAPVRVPASPADASWLARDLAALMDQVETEEISWDGLKDLVPEEYAAYWQLSLAFLRIATMHWPDYLGARGLVTAAARRSLLIDRETARLQAGTGGKPIVAAGSTGSIPATSRLLKAIAQLPHGAVVLPGLPTIIDDESWRAIGTAGDGDAAPSHPLYGMRQLIEAIGIDRRSVVTLASAGDAEARARQRAIVEVFRPADVTDRWRQAVDQSAAARALDTVTLVEAPGDREEATAIALALREFRERDDGRAALVTPDRRLARRVARTLGRWGIEIDDSAGEPLAESPAGVLARLTAETALGGFAPVTLVSLLKHPLALFGRSPAFLRRTARALEIGVLRGPPAASGLAGLRAAIDAARAPDDGSGRRVPFHRRYVDAAAWHHVEELFGLLETTFSALEAFRAGGGKRALASILEMHVAVLRAVVADGQGSEEPFFSRDDGAVLLQTLAGLISAGDAGIELAAADYADFFESLIAAVPVRPRATGDPRLQIWGPLEARLQAPDLTILGGLNEGVWPAIPETDPWLSRPMRAGLLLQPPERRIGLSAHDFMQGLAGRSVVLTRSERSDGAPTVPSRWLQRLRPVAGEAGYAQMKARGARLLDWTSQLDRMEGEEARTAARPAPRPDPRPPLAARPSRLSVTEVETLVRDPYAYYARRVLRLEPVAAIGAAPDFADRGTLIHDTLGEFTAGWPDGFDATALAALIALGRRRFATLDAFPSVKAVWWGRFEMLAEGFLAWERERTKGIAQRHAEIEGEAEIALADAVVKLTVRADRVDRRTDGALDIIDFKTGAIPSAKQVNAGFAPQLPLEGAILLRGGFGELAGKLVVGDLRYVQLKPGAQGFPERDAVPKDKQAAECAEAAWRNLTALLARYRDPAQGYLSRAYPLRAAEYNGPYDHLARVREWSLADGGEDE